MRGVAVCLLLVCLAAGAWWTATPQTAQQAVGWCVQQRGNEIKLVRCLPGLQVRGKVVGAHPQLIDLVGEPPGKWCPLESDTNVRSPLPPRNWWLCLDTQ